MHRALQGDAYILKCVVCEQSYSTDVYRRRGARGICRNIFSHFFAGRGICFLSPKKIGKKTSAKYRVKLGNFVNFSCIKNAFFPKID